jgi:hypothetical protein
MMKYCSVICRANRRDQIYDHGKATGILHVVDVSESYSIREEEPPQR